MKVFSLVMSIQGEPFDTVHANAVRDVHQLTYSETPDLIPGEDGFVSAEFLGDPIGDEEFRRLFLAEAPLEFGDPGYFGARVVESDDESGTNRVATAVATVVEGAFVAVGTVVPAGTQPDPELTAPELLEQLADEVRAHPPA